MSAALKMREPSLRIVSRGPDHREIRAGKLSTLHGEPLTVAVAKFRELADKLESGELSGARIQWRDGLAELEVVTMDERSVQITQYTIEKV